MALSDVNTAMAAAVAALDAADYAAAIRNAMKAQAYLSVLPDSEQSDRSLSFDRGAIDQFLARARELRTESQATSAGIQRTKTTWARTSAST